MSDTTVTLSAPLDRKGGPMITSVGLRKPDVGALRGMKLTDVLQMDVNAMIRLLPRITTPALLPDEVAALDPADFLSIAGTVVGFFMTAEQLAAAELPGR
ncbi:phage tail assembly protein [Albidovulum sp.]|uniref:phage tail assembly protein n=1 Tax=Albidovulum sp. TaxID=1872424 RepID=UPI0039B942D9